MKPAHLAPKSKSNLKNTIAITAITALLASGVAVLSTPASATTATALADGERLTFVPSASDLLAATTTSTRTNGVHADEVGGADEGDIFAPAMTGDAYRYKNVHPTFADVDAVVTVVDIVNLEDTIASPDVDNRLEKLDNWTSNATENKFLRVDADATNSSLHGTAKIRVEFFVSGTSDRVTFPSLGVNAYDIDNGQYVEFEGHSSFQLFSNTHVTKSDVGTGVQRFSAPPDPAPTTSSGGFGSDTATAYTVGRVKVNYTNAHTLVFTLGAWTGSSFEFDFGPGVARGTTQPPAESSSAPSSGGGSSSPIKTVTDISPTQISPNREVITLTGQNLDTATEVLIGGVKARIVSQANGTMKVKPPKGLKGFVDVELKGTLNPVSRIKAVEYLTGKSAAVRKAEIVVGGFAPNSRILTTRIKTRIESLIDKYPELQTVTCTGFTSLPRRSNDVRLSTNRGVEACRFAKAYKPSLVVEVEQGIEDPRPGSNVRRVRVGLTQ